MLRPRRLVKKMTVLNLRRMDESRNSGILRASLAANYAFRKGQQP
jgi:hypothetical protein